MASILQLAFPGGEANLTTRLWRSLPLWFLAACSTASPDDHPSPSGTADAGDPAPNPDPTAPDAGQTGDTPVRNCFDGVFMNPLPSDGPDYDQFGPTVGSHCNGTNHQNIQGVERVVFLGDSVTVGTPPTGSGSFYRSQLAGALAQQFGLDAPNGLWEQVNVFEGVALMQESGDFSSCAKWGARTDDLLRDNDQIESCIPPGERDKTTLVVMTTGGNDIANITKDFNEGAAVAEIWAKTEEFVQLQREAVEWLMEPGRFPNGVYVVFANMYEFTDGTGDTASCPGAALAGYGDEAGNEDLKNMVIWANEQYMQIAVDTQTDMMFMLENFCGHGFNHDDPSVPCYRGPDSPRWFDDTCIHPNPTGHQAITNFFMSVVME